MSITADADLGEPAAPAVTPPPEREVIYRHRLPVRITHWINVVCITLMLMSGLTIFNAHPHLYWGQKGANYDRGWLSIDALPTRSGEVIGVTRLGDRVWNTTGVLGVSKVGGETYNRAWPGWATIPTLQDLAAGRRWHFFFAWLLVLNGLAYLGWTIFSRHLSRDLAPTGADLKWIGRSILDHVQLKHPTGEAAKRYNVLQKLAYLGVITVITLMVLTGLTMSPGFNAVAPFLLDLFGGRQSARSLHFICASLIVLFVLVHVAEVFLAGPVNEIRSMITGRYVVPQPHHQPRPEAEDAE